MISCVTMEIMICKPSEAFIVGCEPPRNLELEMKSGHSQALMLVLATISSNILFNFNSQTALSALMRQPRDRYSFQFPEGAK